MTKIEVFRKCWPRSRFPDNFDQNRDFHKFWPKSRHFQMATLFEKFDYNQHSNEILSKIAILVSFNPNREFPTIFKKIKIFRDFYDFDQNRDFFTISTKVKVFLIILTKINISWYFDQNWHFLNFDQNQDFWTNFTKFEIFRQFSTKSIFPKNLTKNQDFWQFMTVIDIFANFDPNWHFSEIFNKPRFRENFDPNRFYRRYGLKYYTLVNLIYHVNNWSPSQSLWRPYKCCFICTN